MGFKTRGRRSGKTQDRRQRADDGRQPGTMDYALFDCGFLLRRQCASLLSVITGRGTKNGAGKQVIFNDTCISTSTLL